VPQSYLEAFAVDSGPGKSATPIFWVYDKHGGDPRPQTPVNTTVQTHFYTVEEEDGTKNEAVEKLLSKSEGAAVPIMRRWLGGCDPSREELDLLFQFMALLVTRTATAISTMEELHAAMLAADLRSLTPQEVEEHIRRSGSELELDRALKIFSDPLAHFQMGFEGKRAMLDSIAMTDAYTVAFRRMEWGLVRAHEGAYFVTGDAPVCVFVPVGDNQVIFQYGVGLPDAQVSFPLSPTVLMLGFYRQPDLRTTFGDLNRRTARVSDRWVVSPYRSDYAASLVKEAAESIGVPKIDAEEIARDYPFVLRRAQRRKDEVRSAKPRDRS
jgi:hypothetical protein